MGLLFGWGRAGAPLGTGHFSGTHHEFRVPGHGAGVANTSPPTYRSIRDSFLGHWPSGRGGVLPLPGMHGVAEA